MSLQNKIHALSYLVKPKPYALEKPIVLQFPVIDICNSRCQMCRIWENKKSDDLTPDGLRTGLANPLFSEVESVGMNGGEPTLRKDLGDLAAVLFETLPKLRSISLITNAYKHEEVIARIADVGEVVKAHGGHLDVMVSLDGYGEMHDRVRGKPGNFARAQHVIDFIQSSDLVTSVRVGCTIIKENVYGLADLFEYCQEKGLYIKYRLGVPHQRLYTRDLKEPYALDEEEVYHVAEFLEGLNAHYETSPNQRFFYRSLVGQLVHDQPRRAGCDWQHRGATITSKGELLYCAIESDVLGQIQTDDSEQVFFAGAPHLDEIRNTKCAGCNHDYVGLPERGEYGRQLVDRVLTRSNMKETARRVYQKSGLRTLRSRRAFDERLRHLSALGTPQAKPRQPGERPRVLIGGWYGTETLGDKAILSGIGAAIEAAVGPAEFTLVSLNPYVSRMTRAQMPELSDWRIADPEEGARLVGESDLVVFGGGPMMAINELAEMEAYFTIARRLGVPTMLAGCGVGPLGAAHLNAAIGRILQLADIRIYRDAKSRAAAAALGVDVSRDEVAEDPAFTWLAAQSEVRMIAPPTSNRVVLLGLRDFPYRQYASDLDDRSSTEARDRYECAVVEALERLATEDPTLVIRPLPMCTNHYGDDDRWFYRRLFRGNARLRDRLDLSLLGRELDPVAYCKAFREAHVALTMRFHSLVFALGLNVPAVAIDYTLGKGKVRALADRFGVPQQNLAEVSATFLADALRGQMDHPCAFGGRDHSRIR